MKTFLSGVLLFALLLCWGTLPGQNNALDFDGGGDYITLSPINGFPTGPVSDFTVEMWFISAATGTTPGTCNGDFRRLFALGVPNNTPLTLLEVGECNGLLSLFWVNSGGGNLVQSTASVRDNQWHCLSVVRSANNLEVFLDGNLTLSDPTAAGTTHTFSIFSVGHGLAPSGPSPGEDWLGRIDEVKLWNIALPAAQLTGCSNCVLTGSEPGLVAYWQFDQGVPGGNNTSITQANDATITGNNPGTLHPSTATPDPGFVLNGGTGNFVTSGAPLVYPKYDNLFLLISDPLQQFAPISVCDNTPVHFTLLDNNGNIPQPSGGVSVDWFYSDDGGNTWPQITSLSGFQFVVPPTVGTTIGATDINCTPGISYVDREYRAIITVTNSNGTCTYTTASVPLRICCEVTQAIVTVVSTPAGPLCEGDVATFNVSLTTNILPASNPFGVGISWCIIDANGTTPLPQFDEMLSFVYPVTGQYTVGQQDICFKATVNNCGCPSVTAQACIQVDPKPSCGTIIGCPPPAPATLTLIGTAPWLTYEICPGDHAELCLDPAGLPFTNCTPQWQYSWGDPFQIPIFWTWYNLGNSNPVQNTNILPAHFTPAWPTGQQSIFYLVQCNPLSTPSGCDPCYSNIVEIKLKPPLAKPVINCIPSSQHICKSPPGFAILTVQNPQAPTITWYCNGEAVGFGPTLFAGSDACYWVEMTDGCSTVKSDTLCLTVCTAVAIIKCPQDNPNLTPNVPITLDGCMSFSTCGGPYTYFWTWDSGTYISGQGTCLLTHIPALGGTTYTLTVTDAFGCSHTKQAYIKPCQP